MGRNKKITEEDFTNISKLKQAGWSYSAIGKRYGVSGVCIYKYLAGKTKFEDVYRETKNEKPCTGY